MNKEEIKEKLKIDDELLDRFIEIRNKTIKDVKAEIKHSSLKAIGISGSARDEHDMAMENSNSEYLLKTALEELEKDNIKTELIPLRNYDIKYCKACYSTTNTQCHFPCSCYPKGTTRGDDMSNILYDKILEADIIIFATPVNNFKISSLMALFLDRCISLDGGLTPADPTSVKNKKVNIKHTEFITSTADQNIPGSGFVRRFAGKVAGIVVTGHEEGAALAISSLFMTLNHFGMVFAPWSNVYAMSSITMPTFKDKSIVNAEVHKNNIRLMAKNVATMAKKIHAMKNEDWKYDYSSN